MNDQIRARQVRLIDDTGEQLGVMELDQALKIARERGLDLVEVAPQAEPPVCKILDYGKYKYRQDKRDKKRQKPQKLKELRLTTRIDEHDLEVKLRQMRRFLEHENKVKITVIFRGREIVHMDRGRALMDRIVQATADLAKVDQPARPRGRSLQMVLVPLRTKGERHGQNQSQNQN